MEEGKTKTEREHRDQHLTPDNSVGNKSPNASYCSGRCMHKRKSTDSSLITKI